MSYSALPFAFQAIDALDALMAAITIAALFGFHVPVQVLPLASDPARLEWGLRMITVSRCLERIGDHAVDIGEQTAYLVTGEFREFTDASHRA